MRHPIQQFVSVSEPSGVRNLSVWDWPAQNGNSDHVTFCVHGLTRQSRDFDVLARQLSQTRRVLSIDVAGRGHSDWLADPMRYQIPTYVQDMVAVATWAKAQGMQTLDWVGTSMGGLIGMGFCGFEPIQQAFPVRRLVLNDVGPTLASAAIARIGSYVGKHMHFASLDEAAASMRVLSHGFGPHSAQEWMDLSRPMCRAPTDAGLDGQATQADVSGPVRLHYDPAIAIPFGMATEESTKQGDVALWAAYDAIKAKTLVVRGAESDLLLPETVAQMQARGPKATALVLPGIGHAPTFVAADQVAFVQAFLDSA